MKRAKLKGRHGTDENVCDLFTQLLNGDGISLNLSQSKDKSKRTFMCNSVTHVFYTLHREQRVTALLVAILSGAAVFITNILKVSQRISIFHNTRMFVLSNKRFECPLEL